MKNSEASKSILSCVKAGVEKCLSLPAVLALGLAVVACITASGRFNDPDLWWHLKIGQIIWTTHSIPSADTFSFTAANHQWIAHEWLAQLMVYLAYKSYGYAGLVGYFFGLASVLSILIYFLCYEYAGNAFIALFGGLCALFFSTVGLEIRPLLLGHIFLVSELIILETSRRHEKILWLLPPLFALWINCHGSFFFGLGVLFIYWICAMINGRWGQLIAQPWDVNRRRRLGVVMVLSVAALCLNPLGFRLIVYPLDMLFVQTRGMNFVQEWRPVSFSDNRGFGMIAVMTGIFLLTLVRRRDLFLKEFLLAGVAFVLALAHARMLFIFGIIASPILCRLINPGRDEHPSREHQFMNLIPISALLGAITLAVPSNTDIEKQIRTRYPVEAVRYMKQAKISGPLLNEYSFGGYLIWALPEQKIFIDGRADIYDWSGVLAEYQRWINLEEDPQLLLTKYHIRSCLLPTHSRLVQVMRYLPGWKTAYSDEVGTLFVRTSTH